MWIISAPLIAAQTAGWPAILTPLDWLCALIWVIGFSFEAVADWQLMRFKANPEIIVSLFRDGLWHFTRHPNYFGEAVQWWGLYMPAAVVGAWWTIFSPMLMTFLPLRVSGFGRLEKNNENKEGL